MNETLLHNVLNEQPYPLLFVTISGAHLYGFPSPDSDYDLRGAHILPLHDVAGLLPLRDNIEYSAVRDGVEIDLVTYDVGRYLDLLTKKNGNLLEQIYSPLVLQTSPEHQTLKQLARQYITAHHAYHYLGLARNQWELFQKEQRVKPLLYAYRALLSGIYLMQTGEVEANLVHLNTVYKLPHIPDLVARKSAGAERGVLDQADSTFHTAEYERLRAQLEQAQADSALPRDTADKTPLHDFLLTIRLPQVAS
jgi:uncharacterized protein